MPKQHQGLWLPDSETYIQEFIDREPVEFAGGATYQFRKFAAAFPHIKQFRHAVDVGAHCGLWSRVLARCFTRVTAFEPLEEHEECYILNVMDTAGLRRDCDVRFHRTALGSAKGMAALKVTPKSGGWAHVVNDWDATHRVEVHTLDSYELTDVDFLKVDCEGYEYFVLVGGEQTIRRCRPTVVIEQKPDSANRYGLDIRAAITLLRDWGAEQKWEIGGDHCLRWKRT